MHNFREIDWETVGAAIERQRRQAGAGDPSVSGI
jgi:hypothetical protein